ncbi:MAG: right-handed parallel beta-helix repeat-containing protein [Candidatus Micrarchaeia archaeon]|jgi:hypothetical protein
MKKIICLVFLILSLAVFADCIEITEDLDLDEDNESCFIITEDDIIFDCGGNTICEDSGDTCITIDAEGVKVNDCIIEGDSDETAIEIKGDEAEITECVIDNSETGIYISDISSCSVENIEISNSETGMYIKDSDEIEIENIEMTDVETGLSISSSPDVSLKDISVETDEYLAYYLRFKVEDEDEDPIEEAEVTLEASEGSDPFSGDETDENGYTEWQEVHVVEYEDDNEIEVTFILTVEFDDAEYEDEDFEVSETETVTIELDTDVEAQEDEDELAQLNEACTGNTDCASGYCCLQGDKRFTCQSGPAFCLAYECTENDDCDDDEKCENHDCKAITGTCGYADDHKWINYECCENKDCEDDEKCESHECVEINCDCGEIKDHKCEAECCDNNECPKGYKCINMICLSGDACTLDSECKNTEKCVNNFCEEITGSCGYAFEHRWISFECCMDSECSDGTTCVNNVCKKSTQETNGGICATGFIILGTIFLGFYIKRD